MENFFPSRPRHNGVRVCAWLWLVILDTFGRPFLNLTPKVTAVSCPPLGPLLNQEVIVKVSLLVNPSPSQPTAVDLRFSCASKTVTIALNTTYVIPPWSYPSAGTGDLSVSQSNTQIAWIFDVNRRQLYHLQPCALSAHLHFPPHQQVGSRTIVPSGFVYQVPVVLEIQLVAGNTSTWDYSEASGERPDIYPADWQLIVRNINYYAIFPIVFLLVACLGGLWFFICGGLFMVKRRVRKNNIFARYGLKGQNAKQKCTPIFSKCEVLANPIQDPPKTQANGRSSNYSHPRSEVDRSSAVPEVGVRRAIKHASQGSFSNRWQGILHDVAARATPLRDQELDVMANKALRDNASILGLRARRMRDEIPIPEDVIRFVLCNDKSVRGIVLSAKS